MEFSTQSVFRTLSSDAPKLSNHFILIDQYRYFDSGKAQQAYSFLSARLQSTRKKLSPQEKETGARMSL